MNSAETRFRAKCWVRIRPTAKFANAMIKVQQDHKTVNIFLNKERGGSTDRRNWSFTTDGVLHNTSQEVVYKCVAAQMVTGAMNGFNGTLLSYGQAGSGKTYSMNGSVEIFQNRGIIPRALSQIFKDAQKLCDRCFTFMVSYFEIYNENIYDLLLSTCDKQQKCIKRLQIFDTNCGVVIKKLKIIHVHNEEEAINLFFEGQINRVKSFHILNECSSRSNCVFTIYIKSYSKVDSNPNYLSSKLNLVDLSGSERISKTQPVGITREEATSTNKTLLSLEHVISAMSRPGGGHVPFRQSRLTLFLKDSIGGCCNTRLIGHVRPEAEHIEETLSTFRFAMSVMKVKVKPVVQCRIDPCNQIKCLEDDLTRLKKELYLHDVLAGRRNVTYDPLTLKQKEDIKKMVKCFIEGSFEEIEVVNLVQLKEIFKYFKNFSNEAIQDLDAAYRNQYILINRFDPKVLDLARAAGVLPPILQGQTEVKDKKVEVKSEAVATASDKGIEKGKKGKVTSQEKAGSSKTPQKATDTEQVMQSGEEEEEERKDGEKVKLEEVIGYKIERAESAPPRSEQFEVYKATTGCGLNMCLVNNKNLLASKKKEYSLMAREANKVKEDIDRSLECTNCMRCARECEGLTYNELGEVVMTEAEYLELLNLSSLKKTYKNHHDSLKNLRCEICYCQDAVDQSRKKLLHEFDFWYFNKYAHILANKFKEPSFEFNFCKNMMEGGNA